MLALHLNLRSAVLLPPVHSLCGLGKIAPMHRGCVTEIGASLFSTVKVSVPGGLPPMEFSNFSPKLNFQYV